MARSRLSLSISGDTGAKSFRFKDGNFPALVIGMEHGNPVHVPDQFARESNPKGKPMREGKAFHPDAAPGTVDAMRRIAQRHGNHLDRNVGEAPNGLSTIARSRPPALAAFRSAVASRASTRISISVPSALPHWAFLNTKDLNF